MNRIFKDKRLIGTTSILVVLLVVVGVFGFRTQADAGIFSFLFNATSQGLGIFFGWLIATLIWVIGGLLVNLMWLLLAIAQYNQFLASTAVSTGWVVVRDVVNMGFVVVLLAIAIGTILQQQQYNYSQTLPKFLAAAILVNFSKTICGLFIDAAQIVMMTFVGAFSQAGGGNFASLLGLTRLLSMVYSPGGLIKVESEDTQALAGMVLALIFVSLALIVIGIMVAILVIRIIALWFLIILSPAAFFLMSLPNDKGYSSKWWDQFINYLLVGPVMAFFLWLSFTVVAVAGKDTNDANDIYIATELGVHFEDRKFLAGELSSLGTTGISTIGGMAGYILGIGLLIGSLMAAQQLSSVGGSIAGGAISGFKDYMQGKRGPFNPVRYLREGVGGVMARREERRKERVKERVERWDRSLGIAQQIPRELARGVGKAALMTQPGQAAMRWYEQDSTQVGLDTAVRFGTLGVGGWGRVHKARNEARRSDLEHQIMDMEPKAGDHRGQAEQLDRTADEHMKNAMAARSRGDTATETSERAAAQSARDQARDQKRMAAGYENRIQWAKTQLGANKARELAWSGLKTAALISHPLVGVTLGARMTDDMGKRGKESVELAESAQADDVRSRAQKFKDMSADELHAKYASTASNRDKMAINQVLIEKGEIDPNDVENIMQRQKGLGADGLTMRQLNRAVAQKYPTMNWGLDPTRMGLTRADQLAEAQRRVIPLFKDGTIKGEEITAEKLAQNNPDFNGAVFEALSDPRNTKERKDFMAGLQSIKGQKGTDAREAVANIARDEALRNRDANGEFLPAGRELLHIFFEAGGKMDNLLTSLDAAAGVFTDANDQRAFDQIAGNTDLNQHVLHALPEELFDDEANNERPIIQGLIRNTTPAMLRRAREAPEGKSEEAVDQLQRRFGNLANYSNIIDRGVNTAQQQQTEAQTVHQNITNQIDTTINNQTRIQQELATGRTELTARNRAHVDALRNHGVVQLNTRRIMADPASSPIDRMQANQMLQAANAGLAEAANALAAANNTVTRLTAEEVAATQAVNDIRAPGGLYDQLNNATADLQRADDTLNDEQASRAVYQNLNPDAARTVGYLRPYMQYGVLGQQGAGPAAPPPPPTP